MLDFDNLQQMIDQRYISVQKHPTLDLYIHNYTQSAQFDRVWNNETLQCRGLIMDGQHNIIARPFPKFFNVEQHTDPIPAEPFEVFDKLDGSLGILYYAGDNPQLATRGSFTSEQAIKGTQILRTRYANVAFTPGYTFLFEIIYPANRVVVDYGHVDDIYLLTAINTATGAEMPYDELYAFSVESGLPIVERFDGITDIAKIQEMHRDNKEGFVIRFQSGLRLKTKYEEYKRLHKILTGITARRIWELLSNNQSLDDILDRVPDEFFRFVTDTRDNLKAKFLQIHQTASKDFNDIRRQLEDLQADGFKLDPFYIRDNLRKEFALRATKTNHPGLLFLMLEERDDAVDATIWKLIRPAHEVPFKKEDE